jgi:RNA polymerase sigma-70 factor, ECF subfamily
VSGDRLSGPEAAHQALPHWPAAFGLALQMTGRRADAEDLAQEAFLRLARQSGGIDGSRSLRGLVLKIVRNLVIDRARRAGAHELETGELPDFGARAPAESAALGEERLVLRAALDDLSPRWRGVLYLRDGLDLSYREIGEILGITEDVVRVTLHRARKRIRDEMKRRLEPSEEDQS